MIVNNKVNKLKLIPIMVAGDASQANNFHSKECKDDKKISKLLGSWKVVEGTKWIRKPELNPEINPEMFAYLLKPVNTFDHSKKSCGSGTMTGRRNQQRGLKIQCQIRQRD